VQFKKRSKTYTYSYTLQALKEGTFTIPGVSFVVNGTQIKSNSVTIKVTANTQGTSSRASSNHENQSSSSGQSFDKNEVFVKAFASKTNPYQGEQVIITHKLYIGQGVNGGYQVTNINSPTQSGLWSYTLGDPNSNPPQSYETINGKRYTVFEVRRTAVFPQKSGILTVSPLEIGFLARVIYQTQPSGDFFDQFFGRGQRAQDYELNLKSNSIILNVKNLPTKNKPDDFSGIVGNFSLTSSLTRHELKTNDATNLTITLSGNGNLQHIENLALNFPSDFDVTDPKITDNINTKGNFVTGSRIFEYVIIPRNAGDFTINPAQFSYFDLKSNSYKTLTTETFSIKVEKGSGDGNTVNSSTNQKDIKILGNDIRYIKINQHSFSPKRSPFFGSSWFFVLILFPFLFLIIMIVILRKQLEERQNVALTKNKRANKVARKRLKKANKLLHENKKEDFYIEISQVLWGYMSDKFHIPLSQLSMETVETKLHEKQLNEENIKDFMETLNQCEFARFAPGDSTQMMNEMYERTHSFITRIEGRK
ncbi:MAG: BatD family protein, partial [Bacteroidales bacterium]